MPPARVFGFVAAEADVCVLLRRGPAKKVLMVRWNLRTDEFKMGQWLTTEVPADRCDVSPDGLLFATTAIDYRHGRSEAAGPYVAVSRPPYFTALALWPVFGAHTGGAYWHAKDELWIDAPHDPAPKVGATPPGFRMRSVGIVRSAWRGVARAEARRRRMKGTGWNLEPARSYGEPHPYLLNGRPLDAQWADIDHRGRILLAREGRVFVRDVYGELELIDLDPLKFQTIPPPDWAKEWPEEGR